MCDRPLDNSSCVLLSNIGEKRDDDYEVAAAGNDVGLLDSARLPCLSERATFMSASGYSVVKQHPYRTSGPLRGHLEPTTVSVPGFAVEAVPFRWLSRKTFESDLWHDWHTRYDPGAEAKVHALLGRQPSWIMDGSNQQAVIRQFFEPVEPEHSLVFFYLKHSPFQDEDTRRLLVGAALVTDVQLPGLWKQSGTPPFDSSVWETTVVHSLRADQRAGVLLPYQGLVALLDDGVVVEPALAWAPEGAQQEFSYVTEHVSTDTALDALQRLRDAADGLRDLGLSVPAQSTAWIDGQVERLWEERGSTPGLASVLSRLGVERAHAAARTLHASTPDPWTVLEAGFVDPATWPSAFAGLIPVSVGLEWRHTAPEERDVLKLLSTLDVRTDQVRMLMTGDTPRSLPLDPVELLDNPYYATICTYGDPRHVPLSTVDRALFPADHVTWDSSIPAVSHVDDPRDRRRVEALIVEALHTFAMEGDTVASETDVLTWVNDRDLSRPCIVSPALLRGLALDPASVTTTQDWTPVVGSTLGEDIPAYKLLQLAEIRDAIVPLIEARIAAARCAVPFDPRGAIDVALGAIGEDREVDAQEEAARAEKGVGLAELYAAPLTVLVGPAGTGKTTLLKALVDQPAVTKRQVLLLAPTGKASVQLGSKVGRPARTLASFLVRKGGYDLARDAYDLVDPAEQQDYGLVVIDEASMLTEAMLAATLSALGRVDRLVLVGDIRQLPPIGAGRPFVDLVHRLRPASFDGPARVGPGYVELTVHRRQEGQTRDDLLLAQWFGDGDLGPGADAVWERLRTGTTSHHVAHTPWTDDDVIGSLDRLLAAELDWDGHPDREIAFKLTYGGVLSSDGKYLNWLTGPGGAGAGSESWQILSPARSRAFGTVEINRHLKRTLRTNDLALSRKYSGWRSSRPIGPEQIVRGDKVMQTRNDSRARAYPAGAGFNYVANGEIGVVTGSWSNMPNQPAQVEFSSQVGARYSYWPSASDDPALELAWAVTVHKSQGSEFGTTILVLPRRAHLSRELLYTALTRQTDRVVILHEGTVDELLALAHPSRSVTARRLTDLFAPSVPRVIQVEDASRRFDANLAHVADNGVLVRSKNEVIVADILQRLAPGRWSYEVLLEAADRSRCLPDFTVRTLAGPPVYWEHLGMMNQPVYAARWAEKLRWYAANGILPGLKPDGSVIEDPAKRGGPNGILVWTDDARGVDKPAWLAMGESVLGTAAPGAPKKAAKKAVHRPGSAVR